MRKNWFVVFEITKYCKPFPLPWLCAFPSKCKGGCAIGVVGIPLSVEVIEFVGILLVRG